VTSLKIVSWNVEARLSDSEEKKWGSAKQIINSLKKLNGDIVFLPETCRAPSMPISSREAIEKLGYDIFIEPYDDQSVLDAGSPAPMMAFFVKSSLSKTFAIKFSKIRLSTFRPALLLDLREIKSGTSIRFVGVHLHDKHEQWRLQMVADLMGVLNTTTTNFVVLGDFNAMERKGIKATLLASQPVHYLAKIIPHGQIRTIVERVNEMAIGTTISSLQQASSRLKNTDTDNISTITPKTRGLEWMPSIRLVKIDHILISQYITSSDFKVSADGGADHRALSVMIHI
jgi:endonuclease/exonuclease/phosphatase family metal-dependent hydrolase